jgi:multiple antibiotic resistance protein
MKEHLQAIVTVLSLVNPVVCGAMFARIEAGRSRTEQLADATKAAVAMVLILMIAALIGTQLLHLFGASTPSWWRAVASSHGWAFQCSARPRAPSNNGGR